MSEKIRGFINKLDLENATKLIGDDFSHFRYSKNKITENDVEVEITIIEPVYEYQFLLMDKETRQFLLSSGHYKDMADCRNNTLEIFEPVRIIEETKRIRK